MKTRLAAALGAEASADLAWALLEDTLRLAAEAAREAGASLVLRHAPDGGPGPRLGRLAAQHGALLLPQGDGDLGARLARALDGGSARVAIGADSPDLPARRITMAFAALEHAPAVLGPAGDGGFHLVGLAPGVSGAALGHGVRWSSAHALEDARRALGPRTLDVDPWDDVDEPADLVALRARLAAAPGAAPATRAWLAAHR